MRGIKTLIDKLRHGKSRKQHHKLKTKTFPSDADEFFPHLRAEGVALPSHHRRAVFQIIPCNCWKSCNTWEVVIHAVFVHACLKLVHDGSAQNSTRCHKWAYLVQWCRAARRTQWLDCCFWAPAFYPAGIGSLLISNYRAALCATFLSREISYLFDCCVSPCLLAHLVGTYSTKHLSVSLHLQQFSSFCRTKGSWFDLELI